MSEGKFVKFKWLNCKPIGAEVRGQSVVGAFELEDGTLIEIALDIIRSGVAVDFKNPDGSPHHHVEPNIQVKIIPRDRVYSIPRESVALTQHSRPDLKTGVT